MSESSEILDVAVANVPAPASERWLAWGGVRDSCL